MGGSTSVSRGKLVVLEVYRKAPNVALMGRNLVSSLSSGERWRGLHIRDQVVVGSGPQATLATIRKDPPRDSHVTQDKEKEKANSVVCYRHEDDICSGTCTLHGDQHHTSRRMPSHSSRLYSGGRGLCQFSAFHRLKPRGRPTRRSKSNGRGRVVPSILAGGIHSNQTSISACFLHGLYLDRDDSAARVPLGNKISTPLNMLQTYPKTKKS